MKGRMVTAWHPKRPGAKLTVWRPWWRIKTRPFLSLAEVLRYYRPTLDATIGPEGDASHPGRGGEDR